MKDRNNLKYKILSQQWLILLLIILLISVLTALKNPRFLMLNNVMNIFEQIAVLGLVAAGATILIISGNFDISVGHWTKLLSHGHDDERGDPHSRSSGGGHPHSHVLYVF